jgi:DNA helicase-2/ATP-dependent DNA helicase PcrA
MWWNEEIDILDIIAGAKERLLDAEGFAAQVDDDDEVLGNAAEFFRVYEKALHSAGAIDFADMVPLLVRAMDNNSAFAAALTGAYDHVLVDEYQDVNPGQVRLIDHFVKAGASLWVVGDDDQVLYAFRAADVRYILDFPQKYPRAQVSVLRSNYRSAPQIIAVAKRLIANNRTRRHKDYQPVITDAGEVVIRGYGTWEVEARQVTGAVAKLLKNGLDPRQIAVLYRTGMVGLALQPALQRLHIPYEVRGAGDLWQSVAAKLVVGSLHYLRDGESPAAMSRMGSGKRAEIVRSKLAPATSGGKPDYSAACQLVRNIVATAVPAKASERDQVEWKSIVEAVIAVALSCRSFEELESRIAEQSTSLRRAPENAVVLSTIHSAKGLEWEAVLMVGMEEGVLPHANNDDLEEERRVAYVGVTRAKHLLGLTYASMRFGQASRPSQFLHELSGRAQRGCVWTSERANGADERLPLLSDRERQHLNDGALREQAPKRTAKSRRQPTKDKTDEVPARHGLPWSVEEESRLRTRFSSGEPIPTIARAHQRKRGAITSRLMKLGLLADETSLQFD